MAIEHSRNLLIKIGDGASPSEAFTDLGRQSDGNISLDADRIDTSNKTTSGYRTGLAGLRNFVVTCSGYWDFPDSAGVQRLVAEALAGNDFSIRAVYNSSADYFQAVVQATGLSIDGPNNNATQYNTTMELSQDAPQHSSSP